MNKPLTLILASLCVPLLLFGQPSERTPQPDATDYVFRFVPGKDMFYVPWGGNAASLEALLSAVSGYMEPLRNGERYICVSSYGATANDTLTSARMAYLRCQRVKFELILRGDIAESMFVTDRAIVAPYDGLRNVVVVTFPASVEQVAAIAGEEAAARVGVARSARFPSLSLTGKGGVVSSTVEGLGKGNPWAWSAAAALTEPIFAFGRLKRQEASAREAYYQSVFAYEQAVLEAFSDVEDALVSITTYTEQTERYRKLVDANEQIALMTNTLYRSGMSAYLDVIDAERSLYESQMEYSNLVAQQYINYVNLFKALGGGW